MSAEPILIGLLVSIVTGAVGWIGLIMHRSLGKVETLEKQALRVDIAIFGDPQNPVASGMLVDIASIRSELSEHVEEERTVWIKLTTSFTEQKATLERLFYLLDINGRGTERSS